MEEHHAGLFGMGCFGALILGGIGFVLGFFGPIIFTPEANQGPLLGIFPGPVGAVVGFVVGIAYGLWRRGPS